jgi:hypothetical protein
MNETEVAAAIACGALPSPTRFGNSVLVALRVSGTGSATRPSIGGERVFRDPLIWLSEETRASRTPEVEGSDYVKRVTYSEAGHKETRWFGNQTIFKKLSAPTMRATAFLTPQSRQ